MSQGYYPIPFPLVVFFCKQHRRIELRADYRRTKVGPGSAGKWGTIFGQQPIGALHDLRISREA